MMKRWLKWMMLGMVLAGTAAVGAEVDKAATAKPAPDRSKECAAVTISSSKNGETFLIFGTGETGKVADLPAALNKDGYSRVAISSWARRADHETTLVNLLEAGIDVEMYYVLQSGKPDWNRAEIAGFKAVEPEGPQPAPVYVKQLIEANDYNRRHKLPGKFRKVRYITIHNTAEPFTARQERDRVDFRRDGVHVSFHYAVDEREIVQILPLDTHGWHAGDGARGPGNSESIGIEICRSQCRDDVDWLYRRSEANAVLLAASLLKHYGLSVDDLRMHYDWIRKFCPHRILEEKRWDDFRKRVAAALEKDENLIPIQE